MVLQRRLLIGLLFLMTPWLINDLLRRNDLYSSCKRPRSSFSSKLPGGNSSSNLPGGNSSSKLPGGNSSSNLPGGNSQSKPPGQSSSSATNITLSVDLFNRLAHDSLTANCKAFRNNFVVVKSPKYTIVPQAGEIIKFVIISGHANVSIRDYSISCRVLWKQASRFTNIFTLSSDISDDSHMHSRWVFQEEGAHKTYSLYSAIYVPWHFERSILHF